MREIYARIAELEREGRRFAVATVVRTTGSTPQVVGAKLLVDDLGRLVGTLGGGCVEGDAFVEAKRVIETGDSSLREYELTEEPATASPEKQARRRSQALTDATSTTRTYRRSRGWCRRATRGWSWSSCSSAR